MKFFENKNKKILVVGTGNIGTYVYRTFEKADIYIDTNDVIPYRTPGYSYTNDTDKYYDFVYICVDTPYVDEYNPNDISAVEEVLRKWWNVGIYVIKSTILPGTTEKLIKKYNKRIVHSPEFYGTTQHSSNFDFDFTILGGRKEDCIEVQNMLQFVFDARHIFKIVEPKVAELTKYMENTYLANKVVMCNEFAKIANNIGIDYEDVRECLILDTRISPCSTFVYRDKPYYESHCFDKDLPAISKFSKSKFIQSVIDTNEENKIQFLLNNKEE